MRSPVALSNWSGWRRTRRLRFPGRAMAPSTKIRAGPSPSLSNAIVVPSFDLTLYMSVSIFPCEPSHFEDVTK